YEVETWLEFRRVLFRAQAKMIPPTTPAAARTIRVRGRSGTALASVEVSPRARPGNHLMAVPPGPPAPRPRSDNRGGAGSSRSAEERKRVGEGKCAGRGG